MPSERAIVETLNRKELLDLVSYFDLDVTDRRVRDHLVDAIATAKDLSLEEILERLPAATLKSICSKHGFQVEGRGKAAYVAGIAAGAAPKGRTAGRIKAVRTPKTTVKAAKAAKATPAAKTPKAKAAAAKTSKVVPPAKTQATKAAKAPASAKAKGAKASAKVAGSLKDATAAAPKAKAGKAASKAAPKTKAVKAVPKAKAMPKAKAGKAAPKAKAKAVKMAPVVAEIVDLSASAPTDDSMPEAPRARRPRATKAVKGVRAKAEEAVKPETQKAASKAQPPAVKKAKAVSLPPEAEAPVPAPAPSNVIPLPYVNTPAAVAAAEAAATHLRATSDPSLWAQPTTRTQKCASCATKLELRKCTAQKCDNMLIASPTRKICAECMFERNTLSMDDFNARMEEEANCPHCGKAWQKS